MTSTSSELKLKSGETAYEVVRRTCQWMVSVSQHVAIDGDALQRFALSLPITELTNPTARKGFPLKFQSLAAEINFMAVLNLLNFGSGYRTLLHRYIDRGAYDTICFGCIGMHLSGDIDADFLVRVSLHEVSSLFLIPVDEDFQVSTGITSTRAHPLRPLAESLRATLNAAGATLRAYQCADFSQFLLDTPRGIEVIDDEKGSSRAVRAADLIARVVKAFPVMADHYDITTPTETRTVWLLKKAQLLCSELYARFSKEVPKFNFVDINDLTVFADNVLPAVLRQAGVLQVSTKLGAILDAEKTLTDASMECALRSASVVAVDLMRQVLATPSSTEVAQSLAALPRPSFEIAPPFVPKSAVTPATTSTSTPPTATAAVSSSSSDAKDSVTSSDTPAAVAAPSVATATAVEATTSSTGVTVPCRDIDYYLWQTYGKRPDVRAYPRHAAISLYY